MIIDNGRTIAEGTPYDLKNTYTQDYITIYGVDEDEIKELSPNYTIVKNGFRISIPNTKEATDMILKNPELFVDFEITKGRMDDVFLVATGKDLEGGESK